MSAPLWRKRSGRMASKCWPGRSENAADQWLLNVPAIQTLQQVWQEQYTDAPPLLRWLGKHGLPAPTQQIISPYDPDARWATKRSRAWVGNTSLLDRDL